MYTRLNILLLGLLAMFACQTSPDKGVVATETSFEASPQMMEERPVAPLQLGAKAPPFRLPGVDGNYHTLEEYASSRVLAVIFTCNHCPTAQAYEERMIELADDYDIDDVQVIAISPNSPVGLLYEELGYSDLNDDYADMIIRARDANFNFPYLYDGDDHAASLLYGPVATPHAFVFDSERILRYRGRIDQYEKPGTGGTSQDIRAAIDALLADRVPDLAETKAFGCSTKWAWKTDYKEKVDKEWIEREVDLVEVDLNGLKEICTRPAEKIRLVNFWATWCGPCKIEYPEFVIMQRMYGHRDFEFVSISTDRVEKREEALRFLTSQGSAVRNYLIDVQDKDLLVNTVDPSWNGALPFTMLIAPDGQVLHTWEGSIDPLEVKRAIVDQPEMGRYF